MAIQEENPELKQLDQIQINDVQQDAGILLRSNAFNQSYKMVFDSTLRSLMRVKPEDSTTRDALVSELRALERIATNLNYLHGLPVRPVNNG